MKKVFIYSVLFVILLVGIVYVAVWKQVPTGFGIGKILKDFQDLPQNAKRVGLQVDLRTGVKKQVFYIKINGKVKDFNDTAISGATVNLYSLYENQKRQISTKRTASNGSFSFATLGKNSIIKEYSGANVDMFLVEVENGENYNTAYRRCVATKGDDKDLGTIHIGQYMQFRTRTDSIATLTEGTYYFPDYRNRILELTIPSGAIRSDRGRPLKGIVHDRKDNLPAQLPPTSWFTYAVDISPNVELNPEHPATLRIKNTLGIPKLYSRGNVTLPIGLLKDGKWMDVGTAEVETGNEWIKGEISELGPISFNLHQFDQREGIVQLKAIAGGETEWISDIYTTLLLGGLGANTRDGHLKVYKELDKRVIAGNTDRLYLTYSTRYIKPRFLLSFFCNMEKLIEMWRGVTPPDAMGNYSLNFNLNLNNKERHAFIDLEEPEGVRNDLLDIELDDIRLLNLLWKPDPNVLRQGTNRISFSFGINGRFPYGVGGGLRERAQDSVGVLTRENEDLAGNLFRMNRNLIWLDPKSPFGYGWSLNKEERLFLGDDGMITRKTGEGEVMIYEPIGANEPWPCLTSTLRNFNNIVADDNGSIYVSSLTGVKKVDPSGNMDDFASVVDIRAMRVYGGYLYISRLGGVIKIRLNDSSSDPEDVIPIREGTTLHNIKGIDLDNSGNLYAIDIRLSGANKILNRRTGAEIDITGITNPEVLAVNSNGTVFFVANKSRLYKVTSSGTAEEIYKSGLTKDEIVEILRNIHQREWIDAFNEAIAGAQVIRGPGNRLYLADARKGIVWEIDMTTLARKIVSADGRFNADEGPLTGIAYTSHGGGALFLSATWLTSEDNRESRIFRLRPGHKYYRSIAFGSGTYLEKGNVPDGFIPDNLRVEDKEKIKNTGFCLRDIYGNKAVFDKSGLIISKIDNNGNMEKYEYETVINVKKIRITDITGGVTEITYDPASMFIRYPRERETKMTFDGNGDLISVTDPDGGTTNYVYNDHMLESIQGPEDDDNTAISYNENDLVSSITFPTGEVREFDYGLLNNAIDLDALGDARVSIPSVWDGSLYCKYRTGEGHEYNTLYGPFGSPILNINPRGVKQLYIYNKKGLPIATMTAGREDGETEPKRLTNFTLYEDKYNLPTKQIEVSNSPHILAWDFKYKDQFPEGPVQLTEITKIGPGEMGRAGGLIPEGIRGGWLGSLLDNLLSVEISDGYSISYEYDDKGNLTSHTDAEDYTTEFREYDGRGLPRKIRLPNTHEIIFGYDYSKNWNINQITYTGGPAFTFDYDSRGNLKSILNPTGSEEEWRWDSQNRVKDHWMTDTQHTNSEYYKEDGNLDDYGRFKEGLLSKITNTKDGVGIEYKMDYYPAVGLLEKITDFEGHATDLQYDMDRNPVSINLPGGEISFAYGGEGQLEEVTLYSKSYPVTTNIFGQIKEITYPDYTTQLFGYDSRGLLSSVTFRNYDSIAKKYDDLYRLYEKVDGSGTTRYTYDKRSYLKEIAYPSGSSWSYIYDAMGRVTSATNRADSSTVTNSYTSDAWGNLDYSIQDDVRVDYTYDGNNCLLKEFTAGGMTIGYTRYSNDWIDTIKLADGADILKLVYHPDTPAESAINPHISEIKSADSRTVVSYGYDKNWNITSVNDKIYYLEPSGNVDYIEQDGKRIDYEYEGNRLKRVTKDEDEEETEWYKYNDSGEITEMRRNGVPSRLGWENGQLKTLGDFEFEYDDNGNLIRKSNRDSETTYDWDFNNLLTRVNYPDGWVSYKYDAYGRRIAKETSSGEFLRYIYDGYNLIAILDGSGNPIIFLHDLLRLDNPFAMVYRDGNVYYFISDRLGSVTEIIDSLGNTIASFDYDSFGNILNEEIEGGYEDLVNKSVYRFMGREYDKETGLYYFRQRYLDPVSLIFISRDQVLAPETLTFEDALNDEVSFDSEYTFCKNNPVKFVDPFGMFGGNYGPAAAAMAGICARLGNPIYIEYVSKVVRKPWIGPGAVYIDQDARLLYIHLAATVSRMVRSVPKVENIPDPWPNQKDPNEEERRRKKERQREQNKDRFEDPRGKKDILDRLKELRSGSGGNSSSTTNGDIPTPSSGSTSEEEWRGLSR